MSRRQQMITKYEVWSTGCAKCGPFQHGIYADKARASVERHNIEQSLDADCASKVEIRERQEPAGA